MSPASLAEDLWVECIGFLQVVSHETKHFGTDVMVVGLEVVGKSARMLALVLEESSKPRYV